MATKDLHIANRSMSSLGWFAGEVLEFARMCPALNTHNVIELLAMWADRKRVVRIAASDATYGAVKEFCERTQLIYAHGSKKQAPKLNTSTGDTFTVSVPWDDPAGKYFAVVIGKRESEVQKAQALESSDVSFRAFGKLYEFPPCCIEAYADIEGGEEWITAYLRRSPIAVSGYSHGNRLAVLFDAATLIPDFFPCRIGCEATRELGKQYAQLLKEAGWDHLLATVERSLSSPILVRRGTLLQLPASRSNGNVVRYNASRDWQINWRGAIAADDPFYHSDSLTVEGGTLRLFAAQRMIAEERISMFENRLLVFQ